MAGGTCSLGDVKRRAHLGSNVVRRATERGRGNSITDALFAHPEICQLAMALVVQQHIVQFQIPERNQEQCVTMQPGPAIPGRTTDQTCGRQLGLHSPFTHASKRTCVSDYLCNTFR